jgi:hypothetical protein
MDEVETIKPSRKRPLLPDEDLFVSPLSYEGYSYCRNDIRLNSKFSYLYICFLFYIYAESQGLVMADYKCSSFRKTKCAARMRAVIEEVEVDGKTSKRIKVDVRGDHLCQKELQNNGHQQITLINSKFDTNNIVEEIKDLVAKKSIESYRMTAKEIAVDVYKEMQNKYSGKNV